jgi:acetylornithine deacetylase/succinyl-diaminopimelate desuccinylase-like protein
VANFDLKLRLREGGHHSGNWGGLLANPGTILAGAIACLVDGRGRILVPELKPQEIPDSVRRVLAELDLSRMTGPEMDPGWGEPGLTPAEKVFGWSTLDVLAMRTGDPDRPAHAIPPRAFARLHSRFVADQDPDSFLPAIRSRLDECGFKEVEVTPARGGYTRATRLLPDNPWAKMALESLKRTSGVKPAFLPNLGGTLPNDAFSHILGLPTLWVPHSYSGCSQHAPNEHLLAPLAREGLGLMAGLFWDLAKAFARE